MEASVCKMRVSLKMQLIFCSVIYSRKEYIVLFNYFLKKCGCASFCTHSLFPPAATNRIEFCGKPCSDQGTVPPCITSQVMSWTSCTLPAHFLFTSFSLRAKLKLISKKWNSPGVSCDLYHNYIRIKLQEKGETVCDDTIFYSDTQTHVLY